MTTGQEAGGEAASAGAAATASAGEPADASAGLASVRAELVEMSPLLRRVTDLDPASLARVRTAADRVAVLVRLPFAVLAARTVVAGPATGPLDRTFRADELLAWLEGERADPPPGRDEDWRGAAPPVAGWRRVDTVPDDVVRGLVRSGALALKDAAAREGVPGAQPRAEVADALLDAVVLIADGESGTRAELTLRTLSALTRMGFLARDSHAVVDVAGRWTRVAGRYGSIYAERASAGLGLGLAARPR